MSAPGSIAWLAGHELRLSWRDWFYLLTAGKRRRAVKVTVMLGVAAIAAHTFAWFIIRRFTAADFPVELANYILVTGGLTLYFCLMIAQSMEAATRVLYARADLDLLHSSPAALTRVFVVRLTMIAASIAAMALLLAAPFINVAVILHGPSWLAAYGVVLSMSCIAAAFSVSLTAFLFRVVGARQTRFVAQIVAAIVGALFIIGLQVVAIYTSETLSHLSVLRNEWIAEVAPDVESVFWWPARAVLGDLSRLAWIVGAALLLLSAVIAFFSRRFVSYSANAANMGEMQDGRARGRARFRWTSPNQALRHKEWTLLLRDPWLISQTLMQLLYLLPPALLLWRSYGHGSAAMVIMIPVLVMAAGQLAGGLAWLAISGEDAPDLVATAPVQPRNLTHAKVEAVITAIVIVTAPFVVAFALSSLKLAAILAVGVVLAAGSATMVQLWFRSQARRAQFHRRQTSSRVATFAEAFSSIGWAGTAGLFAGNEPIIGTVAAVLTLGALGITRAIAPRREA